MSEEALLVGNGLLKSSASSGEQNFGFLAVAVVETETAESEDSSGGDTGIESEKLNSSVGFGLSGLSEDSEMILVKSRGWERDGSLLAVSTMRQVKGTVESKGHKRFAVGIANLEGRTCQWGQ